MEKTLAGGTLQPRTPARRGVATAPSALEPGGGNPGARNPGPGDPAVAAHAQRTDEEREMEAEAMLAGLEQDPVRVFIAWRTLVDL